MILIIRHARKSLTGDQGLTNQGFVDALNYGKNLKKQSIRFDEIISSPVKRCIQTAEKIVDGLKSSIDIQKSHLFGEPGIFVADDKKAAKVFAEFNVCEVINMIIKKKSLPGFLSIDEACKPLVDEIEIKTALNKSVLYVSHDAIIMPFIAYINKIKEVNRFSIVGYLDGYIIEKPYNRPLHLTAIPFPFHSGS